MRKYNKIEKTVEKEELVELQCDICKKTYKFKNNEPENVNDIDDIQEFHHITIIGGYGSVFGDMNRVTADICQYCLKKKLGDYLHIESNKGGKCI